MTQDEVAQALGVSRQAVAHWESGNATPDTEHLGGYLAVLRELRDRL